MNVHKAKFAARIHCLFPSFCNWDDAVWLKWFKNENLREGYTQ